jgi:hypothetical protein
VQLYHDFFICIGGVENIFRDRLILSRLTRFLVLGDNAAMSTSPNAPASTASELPDRLCTWCKVPMNKRLVASGQFIHYTCPKCIFQHTTRRGPKPPAGH